MLQVTMNPTPGLSAAADRALTASDLGTARYRHWVQRAWLASSALGRKHGRRRVVDRADQVRQSGPKRISVPSAASGTLSRLP